MDHARKLLPVAAALSLATSSPSAQDRVAEVTDPPEVVEVCALRTMPYVLTHDGGGGVTLTGPATSPSTPPDLSTVPSLVLRIDSRLDWGTVYKLLADLQKTGTVHVPSVCGDVKDAGVLVWTRRDPTSLR